MKSRGNLDVAKQFSAEIKNGPVTRTKGELKIITDRRIRVEPKENNEYWRMDGPFPHFLTLSSNFQMKGQKMKLFSRKSVIVNKLYRSASLASSVSEYSVDNEQLYEPPSPEKIESYEAANYSYYPDKFHVLKEQMRILHQVINNRSKRIVSLNDVVNNLQEQRQQLQRSCT